MVGIMEISVKLQLPFSVNLVHFNSSDLPIIIPDWISLYFVFMLLWLVVIFDVILNRSSPLSQGNRVHYTTQQLKRHSAVIIYFQQSRTYYNQIMNLITVIITALYRLDFSPSIGECGHLSTAPKSSENRNISENINVTNISDSRWTIKTPQLPQCHLKAMCLSATELRPLIHDVRSPVSDQSQMNNFTSG